MLSCCHAIEVGELLSVISRSKPQVLDSLKDDVAELPSRLSIAIQSSDDTTVASALLAYWLFGGEGAVYTELSWWKSKSPLLRSLAAALLLTGRAENTSNAPHLDAMRFGDKEREERLRELQLVLKNEKRLGSALEHLIDEAHAQNPTAWLARLKLRFSRF